MQIFGIIFKILKDFSVLSESWLCIAYLEFILIIFTVMSGNMANTFIFKKQVKVYGFMTWDIYTRINKMP